MTKVYLVLACYCYEGSDAVKAYADEAAAKAFASVCGVYHGTRSDIPSPPPIEDTPENDAAHDKWYRKVQRWERKHPAGSQFASADSFIVKPVEFVKLPGKRS